MGQIENKPKNMLRVKHIHNHITKKWSELSKFSVESSELDKKASIKLCLASRNKLQIKGNDMLSIKGWRKDISCKNTSKEIWNRYINSRQCGLYSEISLYAQ